VGLVERDRVGQDETVFGHTSRAGAVACRAVACGAVACGVLLGDGARNEAAGVEQYVLVRGD
jgi:hypothetical protein